MNIEQTINQRLEDQFKPSYLKIENESYQHNVPANSETHFKVVIVSSEFEQKSRVARHQMIYQLLSDLMPTPIHALSLHTFDPKQWKAQKTVPETPNCLDGFGE